VSRQPLRHRRALCAAALAACVTAAACGTPPELQPTPGVPVPSPSPSPSASASPTPGTAGSAITPSPLVPTPSGFPEAYAVECAGRPTGAQVVRVLRRDGDLLPGGAQVSVDTGPLCAGTWQYTVVTVPGREPLAVVTRGRPGALRLVTAGTNVCSIPVRTQAPPGIRSAAACL
jgi:hypothetical protein